MGVRSVLKKSAIVGTVVSAVAGAAVLVGAISAPGVANACTISIQQPVLIGDIQPVWSPDGSRVAFVHRFSPGTPSFRDGTIEIRDLKTHRVTRLHRGDEPSWSPDGTQLVFRAPVAYTLPPGSYVCGGSSPPTEEDLFVAAADGSDPLNITNTTDGWEGTPSWSARNRIAYGFFGATHGIAIVNPEGSKRRVLFSSPNYVIPPSTETITTAQEPDWSPSGKRLAFVGDRGISLVGVTGAAHPRFLAVGNEPAWSPDGRKIAFTKRLNGKIGVYVMRANGSHIRYVARGTDPSWSPDSNRLVYTHEKLVHTEQGIVQHVRLYVVDLRSRRGGRPLH